MTDTEKAEEEKSRFWLVVLIMFSGLALGWLSGWLSGGCCS